MATVTLQFPNTPYLFALGKLYQPNEQGQVKALPEHVWILRQQGCTDPGTTDGTPVLPVARDLPPAPGMDPISWSASGTDHPGTGAASLPIEMTIYPETGVASGELVPPTPSVPEELPPSPEGMPPDGTA